MPKLTIIIGPSGAGKSTYLCNNHLDCYILSADFIREELYGDASIQGGKEVWDIFYHRLEELVSDAQDIVIDNTNIKAKYRKEILDRCKDYEVKYVIFLTPLWLCLSNNQSRSCQVPESVIMNMHRSLSQNLTTIMQETNNITFEGSIKDGN